MDISKKDQEKKEREQNKKKQSGINLTHMCMIDLLAYLFPYLLFLAFGLSVQMCLKNVDSSAAASSFGVLCVLIVLFFTGVPIAIHISLYGLLCWIALALALCYSHDADEAIVSESCGAAPYQPSYVKCPLSGIK